MLLTIRMGLFLFWRTLHWEMFFIIKCYSKASNFSPGQHKLVVKYLGFNGTAPLTVNYFVQQYDTSIIPSLTGFPSSTSISSPSGSSSNSSPGKLTDAAIIGGVIGALVFISLLIALFFFFCRRTNRRSNVLSEMSYTVPSPDIQVVNPFPLPPLNSTSTFLPENYTSNGQSLPSQSIPTKFSHRNRPSDPASTSNSGGIPHLTPLGPRFQVASPAFIPPSSESPRLPLIGLQINLDDASPRVPQNNTTEPSIQRLPSPLRANARFLWHEDSGVRIPPAASEDDVVEFPPRYIPG